MDKLLEHILPCYQSKRQKHQRNLEYSNKDLQRVKTSGWQEQGLEVKARCVTCKCSGELQVSIQESALETGWMPNLGNPKTNKLIKLLCFRWGERGSLSLRWCQDVLVVQNILDILICLRWGLRKGGLKLFSAPSGPVAWDSRRFFNLARALHTITITEPARRIARGCRAVRLEFTEPPSPIRDDNPQEDSQPVCSGMQQHCGVFDLNEVQLQSGVSRTVAGSELCQDDDYHKWSAGMSSWYHTFEAAPTWPCRRPPNSRAWLCYWPMIYEFFVQDLGESVPERSADSQTVQALSKKIQLALVVCPAEGLAKPNNHKDGSHCFLPSCRQPPNGPKKEKAFKCPVSSSSQVCRVPRYFKIFQSCSDRLIVPTFSHHHLDLKISICELLRMLLSCDSWWMLVSLHQPRPQAELPWEMCWLVPVVIDFHIQHHTTFAHIRCLIWTHLKLVEPN